MWRYILLAALSIVPAAALCRTATRNGRIYISHVPVATIGFLYYFVLPLYFMLLARGTEVQMPGIEGWLDYAAGFSDDVMTRYMCVAAAYYVAFLFGTGVGAMAVRIPAPIQQSPYPRLNKQILLIVFAAVTLPAMWYAFRLRTELFSGYSGEMVGTAVERGSFSAAVVLILVIVLLHLTDLQKQGLPAYAWSRIIRDPYVLIYGAFALLSLSMGSRLYVASAVMTFLVHYTLFERPLKVSQAILAGAIACVGFGAVGANRHGESTFTAEAIITNVAQEALFVNFSAMEAARSEHLQAFAFPRDIGTSLVNLVPTALWPGKLDILAAEQEKAGFYSPVGGLHLFASLSTTFGYLGAVVPIFAAGFALERMRRIGGDPRVRVCYVLLCGWLLTTLFRDAFSISVVKLVLQFSIFAPVAVWCCTRVMSDWCVSYASVRNGHSVLGEEHVYNARLA